MDIKRAGINVTQPHSYKAFIPNPLPPGVEGIGSTTLELVQNSWREL